MIRDNTSKYVTISDEESVSRLNYGSAKIIRVIKNKDLIRAGPLYEPGNETIYQGICHVRLLINY